MKEIWNEKEIFWVYKYTYTKYKERNKDQRNYELKNTKLVHKQMD